MPIIYNINKNMMYQTTIKTCETQNIKLDEQKDKQKIDNQIEEQLDKQKDEQLDEQIDAQKMDKQLNDQKNEQKTVKEMISEMMEQTKSVGATMRTLKRGIKELPVLHKYELKKPIAKKKKKRKPKKVPEQIRSLLNLDENVRLTKHEVTKKIHDYIEKNELQDPNDSRTIIPNKELQELFNLDDAEELCFNNIYPYIKKLY